MIFQQFLMDDVIYAIGLPPDFDFSTRGGEFVGWAATLTYGIFSVLNASFP
jgi:hypothetical protein